MHTSLVHYLYISAKIPNCHQSLCINSFSISYNFISFAEICLLQGWRDGSVIRVLTVLADNTGSVPSHCHEWFTIILLQQNPMPHSVLHKRVQTKGAHKLMQELTCTINISKYVIRFICLKYVKIFFVFNFWKALEFFTGD